MTALFAWRWGEIPWQHVARPLPLFAVVAAGATAYRFYGPGGSAAPEARAREILRLSLLVLALCLLGKMVLNARVHHYGFALAAPAALLLVVALVGWIPAWIASRGGAPRVFQAVALCALAATAWAHVERSDAFYARKTHRVGAGADAFWADVRGSLVQPLLDDLAERLEPGETLVALPEGAMLNYLARVENPTPYTTFAPTDVIAYGEAPMIAAFEAAPPDYVALVHKDTSEFGARFFGRDYAEELGAWVLRRYTPVMLFGSRPLAGRRFGILLLARTPPAAPAGAPAGDAAATGP